LRKALFAILLVGAAFAGGAAMNGPGLERIKAALRARLAPPEPTAPAPDLARAKGPPEDVPAAPLPPLVPSGRTAPPPVASTPRPPDPVLGRAGLAPERPTIAVAPPPPRSEARPIELVGPDPSPSPPGPPKADARTSDPAVAAAMTTASRSEPPARDWADLRRRMRDLGVSRYEIDGEPGGRARFRCLIPLAGRRAVGQQFEGEGDDDFQAAEAALRRVALWKATEMAPP
jgi:hypothetical protein